MRYPATVSGSTDRDLVQIVDAALAEAAVKSGEWLACRPGCTQCCIGPFPINQLDVRRMQHGWRELASRDPDRAESVLRRAQEAAERARAILPGHVATGMLHEDAQRQEAFFEALDEEPCPALDPESGTCDLYNARPLTCRLFGPPLRYRSASIGICELCFHGATDAEIIECKVDVDGGELEQRLNADAERASGLHGDTTVAFALALLRL